MTEEQDPRIEIYSLEWCPYCEKAKNYFKSKGYSYQEYDIEDEDSKAEMTERTGGAKTVPQIFINDQLIGGYDDLMEKKHSGELYQIAGFAAEAEVYEKHRDLVIIGAGPAGLNAALYGARKGLDVMIVAKALGGQMLETGEIDNYLGLPGVEGADMMEAFWRHVSKYDVIIELGEEISAVEKIEDGFQVQAKSGGEISGRSLIIASGTTNRKLNVPGEEKFNGQGVHYCATCDGHLYAGEKVAVIGGGNSGLEAALDLARLDCQISLVEFLDNLTGDKVLADRVKENDSIKVYTNHGVDKIEGDNNVETLRLEHAENGEKLDLEVAGVFVEIGLIPNNDFVEDMLEFNDLGEIKINNKNETSLEGIWAAGDVTSIKDKQVIVAAAEGAKAALRANEYLCQLFR